MYIRVQMEKQMNIKRVLIAFVALSLTPVLAMAQIDITPAEGTANVSVQKVFFDGSGPGPGVNGANNETPVTLTLECTSGIYSPSTVEVQPNDGFSGMIEHIFVIAAIPDGPDNVCTVVEAPVPGYTAEYRCRDASDGDPNDFCNPDANVDADDYLSLDRCQFDDVQVGDVAYCVIRNYATPVDVEVTKVWEFLGSAQADVDQDVTIYIQCDAEIVGGYEGRRGNRGTWYDSASLYLDDGDFDDEDDEYTGMGTVTFEVIPEFYSTAADPDDQDFTECFAWEDISDSYVEVDNDCGDIEVAAGMGDECTITNTVFFEGIPTLNQYGMAIMALLMLGMGFVGFRRFV
jgi:hypothetical protein